MRSEERIAFVIDALPSIGGGEKVLFTALEVFPNADLFTLVYNKKIFAHTPIVDRNITTSFIDHIPFSHVHHRLLLPIMPFAVERFDLADYEIIISFSYAVAHGAQSPRNACHLSYTYTPMRYAWTDLNIDGTRTRKNRLVDLLMESFRSWDKRAASRVHRFAAISHAVSRRIADAYQREATEIYPPVDIDRFTPAPQRENFYITVTRLVPHKRIDILVQAFSQLKLPLVVVGEGPELPSLRNMAGTNITFLGYQPDEEVGKLLAKARGFVCATEEDFGIAMVEAQAAGCPVIAYAQGGALETVKEGVTGLFFYEQSTEGLSEALQTIERTHASFYVPDLVENAQRFNKSNFTSKFVEFVKTPFSQ
jgi:glycosyltransferase involved in cell wall biosynthesis